MPENGDRVVAELAQELGVVFPLGPLALGLGLSPTPAPHHTSCMGRGVGGYAARYEKHVGGRAHAVHAHAPEVRHERRLTTVPGVTSRVAVAVCSAIALIAAQGIARDTPHGWERSVMRWVAGWPDAVAPPLWLVMQAGSRGAIVVAALFVVRRLRVAAVVAAAGVLAWVLAMILKQVAERPRPTASAVGASLRDNVEGYGFPSSHTAIALALATAVILSTRPPPWLSVATFGIAVLAGCARLYFGVHWPLDVVGGAAVGVLAGSAVTAVAGTR